VLAACREAALDWADLLDSSDRLRIYQRPELDIVSYFPLTAGSGMAAIDKASARMLADGMADGERPLFVSTLTVAAEAFARRHPDVTTDMDQGRILRSVLMKPESQFYVAELHARAEALASL